MFSRITADIRLCHHHILTVASQNLDASRIIEVS